MTSNFFKEMILQEFDHEMATTRKILERVPFEKFEWAPHTKSTLLGRLANHVATLPRLVPHIVDEEKFAMVRTAPLDVKSAADIVHAFDDLAAKARVALEKATDEHWAGEWEMNFGERQIFKGSRALAYRTLFMDHLIHHRAQLGVYLRLNDVAIPGSYGPSADEPM
jgi:uncharacterized damage-inducible protein DinB